MNTTIETTTQPINETWIKVSFAVPNDYSNESTWLDTQQNSPLMKELNDIKNLCVTKPKEYAKQYGKSLLSLIKEKFPTSEAHKLEVWSPDTERHELVKVMFKDVQSVTGFRGNIVKRQVNKGLFTVNWGQSDNQSNVEPGKGAEVASQMEPLQ